MGKHLGYFAVHIMRFFCQAIFVWVLRCHNVLNDNCYRKCIHSRNLHIICRVDVEQQHMAQELVLNMDSCFYDFAWVPFCTRTSFGSLTATYIVSL